MAAVFNPYWTIRVIPIDIGDSFYVSHYFKSSLNLFGLLEYDISWTKEMDHAGLHTSFTFFFISFFFQIYDNRHWDDEKENWENN